MDNCTIERPATARAQVLIPTNRLVRPPGPCSAQPLVGRTHVPKRPTRTMHLPPTTTGPQTAYFAPWTSRLLRIAGSTSPCLPWNDEGLRQNVTTKFVRVCKGAMDDDDIRRSCPHCRMDRVGLSGVPECALGSLRNLYIDLIVRRRPIGVSLTRDDRIFYLVGLVLTFMTLRLFF